MKKNNFFLAIIILTVLQAALLNYFAIFSVKPDLLFISMIYASLSFNLKEAVFLSILAGILKDIFTITAFGINTFLFSLWSLLIVILSRKVRIENKIARSVLVFVAVILNSTALRLINLSGGNFISLGVTLRIICLEAFYTAGASFLLFKFLDENKNA